MTPHIASPSRSGLHRQWGMTLIEVMVAIALGLLVTGAVLGVFIAAGRNFREDEALRRMQESARFALKELSVDLGAVDFFGYVADPNAVDPGDLAMPPGADCGNGTTGQWAVALDTRVKVKVENAPNDDFAEPSGTQAHLDYNCIKAADFVPGTEVLAIKRTAGERIAISDLDSGDNGAVFMCRSGASGKLIQYDNASANCAGDDAWPYLARVYFIRNTSPAAPNVPTLYRYQLGKDPRNGSKLKLNLEPGGVAPGIEYFRVLFGIDTDNNGVANYYDPVPNVNTVAAKIYVLIRAIDPDPSYTDTRQYHMGDVCWSYTGTASDKCRDFPPDHLHRRVYSTTVELRNPKYRSRHDAKM